MHRGALEFYKESPKYAHSSLTTLPEVCRYFGIVYDLT